MKYNAGKAEMMLNKWDTIKSDWTLENVSGKGSKEIQMFLKLCMVPGGWRVKEEEFCNRNHDLEVSLKGF